MVVSVKRRYRYRAYPTGGQERSLARLFGCCRVVYNLFVLERRRLYEAGEHKDVSLDETRRSVTTVAKRTPEYAFLNEVSSVPVQNSAMDAAQAQRNFLASISGRRKGPPVGPPTIKKRRHEQKARFTRNARFAVLPTPGSKWGKVQLPGIGVVRFRKHRDLPGWENGVDGPTPSSVTVILNPDGTYEVSFVVDVNLCAKPVAHPGRITGLDAGFAHLASQVWLNPATGEHGRNRIDNPRPLKAALRKLAREQRHLSRCQKGSANRHKARLRVAKTHARVARIRADHHRKLAVDLATSNELVAHETLALRGMGRTRMSKSVYDAGLGTLLNFLGEAAETQGWTPAKAGRWDPTSHICAVCGHRRATKLSLSERTWQCNPETGCGTWLDRDYNAAVNVLLAAGLAESVNACGGDTRRILASADPETIPTDEEAGTHRTDLNPSPDGVQAA